MITDSMALATGIPSGVPAKKSTRRGGRSGSSAKAKNDPMTHHAAAGAAIKAGDHKAATSHLFKALGAVRAQATAGPSADPGDGNTDDTPSAIESPTPTSRPSVPPRAMGGMSQLAGLLRRPK